ncbi:unnamed protein product [marine sediment metagenome]|uniref:Uncharacterized protein n=1 Tax=marine sediment metagenome TaxID=412755 RepID=X1CQB7_9ZZZZ
MQLSWTARILLIVGGVLVGLVGLFMWADESEHGGWAAMEGLEEGYLAGSSVEIRPVPWSNQQDEMSGTYDVRLVEGDTYEVAFVDRQGEVLYIGTSPEVQVWLDDQGEQMFVGTRAGASAWTDEQRDAEKSFVGPGIIIGLGVLLVIVGVIPNRRTTERNPDITAPLEPAI